MSNKCRIDFIMKLVDNQHFFLFSLNTSVIKYNLIYILSNIDEPSS